jgi:hypothetical protein
MWFGIAVAFTFTAHWRASVIVLATLPLVFFVAGWWFRGPRASNHRFRFTWSFFEPVVALAIPALVGKVIDAGLKALAGL